MGCLYSRMDGEQMIARCKARKRYLKQLVKARQALSATHSLYLRSLRNTGSALLQFATAETAALHLTPPPTLPTLPPPHENPAPTAAPAPAPAPPSATRPYPPPLAAAASTWDDFWTPFFVSGPTVNEEVWEHQTAIASEAAVPTNIEAEPSPVVTTATSSINNPKEELLEIIREVDDYFLKAANAGTSLSLLLDVPIFSDFNRPTSSSAKNCGHGKSFSPLLSTWGSGSAKWNAFGKFCEDHPAANKVDCLTADGSATHCSTVERLYTWERKLYQEVKNVQNLKAEHDKKIAILRKLEMKGADYIKTEKAKKEKEKLESQVMVALQAIETTSTEIIKLRESELYPQLLQLVMGLMNMWGSIYEFHQVQMHTVQRLKHLNFTPSTEPTSEIHRQSALQLELDAQQWHLSFCNLINAQRDYIQSLTGWLRLSLFQVGNNPVNKTKKDAAIYAFCEEWQLAINNAPDKGASEGLKSFLSMIHAIVVQQAEEQKQKRRSESAFKELEKRAAELRLLESKHGPYLMAETSGVTDKNPVREKRSKVEALRAKAEDEKAKYEKLISVTRAMSINNLQMGLPHVFHSMTGFANSCTQAFESVHTQAQSNEDLCSVKK